jgi:hypothetical protein
VVRKSLLVLLQGICYRIGSVTVAKVKDFLYSIIEQVAEPHTKEYETEELRTHALSYGWPQEVVRSMTMHPNGTVKFSHPKHKEAAMTLNYGTQDVPPSPAISTYLLGVM